MNQQEYADLIAAEGLKPGYPYRTGLVDGQSLDREVCDHSTCERCGQYGLGYQPYRTPEGGYRAFAVCPSCEWAYEF